MPGCAAVNPNYVHTITLYRKQNGAWTRTVLHNCFWKSPVAVTQNGVQASQANTYTVRIPAEVAGEGFKVSLEDIVVHGECTDQITGKVPNTAAEVMARNKPEAFKVMAFSDNTAHRMGKHYRLGG